MWRIVSLTVPIVDARDQLNLTQKEVADKLKVSQPYIAKLERGDANPTIGKIGGMLALLGLRLTTQTEPLLPQPRVPHIVIRVNTTWDFALDAEGTAVSTGVLFSEEPSRLKLHGEVTVPANLPVAGSLYGVATDIRKSILVGGAVE